MRIFLTLLFIGTSCWAAKVAVDEQITRHLNGILTATNELHTALYADDERQVETAVEKTLVAIDRCLRTQKKQYHLQKLLRSVATQLELTRMKNGDEKVAPLKEAFRQIVQITQSYETDRYRIFFCKRDKSVWLQKSWKAKNPFEPKGQPCGTLVR